MRKDAQTTKIIRGSSVNLVNATLADKTGSIPLAIWGNDIERISLGATCEFSDLITKEFDGKYISTTKKTTHREIDDIGPVNESAEENAAETLDGVIEMINVTSTTLCGAFSRVCMQNTTGKLLIKCDHCSMKQRVNSLKPSIAITLKVENRDNQYTCNRSEILNFRICWRTSCYNFQTFNSLAVTTRLFNS